MIWHDGTPQPRCHYCADLRIRTTDEIYFPRVIWEGQASSSLPISRLRWATREREKGKKTQSGLWTLDSGPSTLLGPAVGLSAETDRTTSGQMAGRDIGSRTSLLHQSATLISPELGLSCHPGSDEDHTYTGRQADRQTGPDGEAAAFSNDNPLPLSGHTVLETQLLVNPTRACVVVTRRTRFPLPLSSHNG